MDILRNFTFPGILLLLTLAFGFWVSGVGKPYNGLLFNLHKLIALGAVVVTILQLSKTLTNLDSPVLLIALLIAAAICVVALFTSGALMSMGKLDYARMLAIHRIAPAALIISMVLFLYLLQK